MALPFATAATRCVVCDADLQRPAARAVGAFSVSVPVPDPYPTCQAVACRMVASRRAEMGEPGFRHYLQVQARHTRHLAALARVQAQRKAAETAAVAAAFATLSARLGPNTDPQALHLVLPSGPRRAARIGAQRLARYRQHLQAVVAEAQLAGPPAPAVAATSDSSSMPGQVCALCGGGCCTKGGEQAYLTADTMRRFMLAQPLLSGEQVVAAYLARLTEKSQAGSCINHTGQGCSLPREMRSDICNRFSCESLARLQAAQRAGPVQAVLIVRRSQDHWRRAEPSLDNPVNALAVLREQGLRRVKPARPGANQPTAAAIAAKVS